MGQEEDIGSGAAFNVFAIGQRGRLEAEAILLAASLRASEPEPPPLFIGEPQPGPAWSFDPRMTHEGRAMLEELGARVVPFEARVFGESYPNANKAEGLAALPSGEPFLFLDTDTLVTGPLSEVPVATHPPSASMRRTDTWPRIQPYGPGYGQTWRALYDRFGLDFEASLDRTQPDEFWQRYLYFNAGWFTGPCPRRFGTRLTEIMREIRDDPPEELICQTLYPWLDQIALPLALHEAGGARPGPELSALDGPSTLHYRAMPLLYATAPAETIERLERIAAPNRIKKLLKRHEAFRRFLYQGKGHRARELFAGETLPRDEAQVRNRLRRAKLWSR